MRLLNRKAQSTLEYAIIVAVVVGALLSIQLYLKRGVQGRIRSSVDNIGEQYSAGNTTGKFVTTQTTGKTTERVGTDSSFSGTTNKGVTRSEVTTAATTTRSATGDTDKEQITKKLSEEELFPDDTKQIGLYE